MATDLTLMPPPLKLSAIVQSFGATVSAGPKGGVGGDSGNSVEVAPALYQGYSAILSAAASVVVGAVDPAEPEPVGVAAVNSALQFADGVLTGGVTVTTMLAEFTHEAMMLANVSISADGTTPLPAGVTLFATPVPVFTRLFTVAKALSRPVLL